MTQGELKKLRDELAKQTKATAELEVGLGADTVLLWWEGSGGCVWRRGRTGVCGCDGGAAVLCLQGSLKDVRAESVKKDATVSELEVGPVSTLRALHDDSSKTAVRARHALSG